MVIGLDEVGRGALAGPLVVVAYALRGKRVDKLDRDPKTLSKKAREGIVDEVKKNGRYTEAWVSNEEIDRIGIDQANQRAFYSAVIGFLGLFRPRGRLRVLVDGKWPIYGLDDPKSEPIIKGDEKIYEIKCAALIAKVERDKWMGGKEVVEDFKWGSNSGYGTQEHVEAIKRHGVSQWHRKSFLGNTLLGRAENSAW